MSQIPQYTLSDGSTLPAIGFGTYPLKGDEGVRAVASAIDAGYRLIDTAVNYQNEDAVGRGIAASGLPRDQVQLTTKLPGRDHGFDETLASFDRSCSALGVDYLDLYLIHWPNPSVGKFVDSWRAMIRLQEQGRVRSIGVSNFTQEFLTRLQDETGVLPVVNQVELHPFFPQVELLAFHEQHGIRTEAWSPLGKRAPIREEHVIVATARAHGVTEAQVILRWQVERGVLPIPKTANMQRQRENIDVFSFHLSSEEVTAITALGRDTGRLFDGDPNTHEEM
ncbi:aldo/keto reductase [Rathayibacter soli]|uniref:aldo/keto reductase n=1 Tax=Rathayibacter soli TaxID=3144168 RepID=UPI0027E5BCAE|nr:aldo/keto reductase [Glaciibacter superstes]